MSMVWPCHDSGLVMALLMVFLQNALMCILKKKKVKLINHDCLPILMLLHIMFAYLMLFAALSNAVCFCYAFFSNDFCFHSLSWFIDTYLFF